MKKSFNRKFGVLNRLVGRVTTMRSNVLGVVLGSTLLFSGVLAIPISVSAASKPVTITLWYSPREPTSAFRYLIHRFEATHRGISVKLVPVSQADSYVKYTTAMASGTAPNVVMTEGYGHIMVWAADHLTQPLNTYIKKYHLKLPRYWAPIKSAMSHRSQIYGLPEEVDEPLLLYNKSRFAKAGIKAPPKTMTQLKADVKRLTIIRNGKVIQTGLIPSQRWGNNIWVKYFGGAWFNTNTGKFIANNPHNITAFKVLRNLYQMQGGLTQANAFVSAAKFGNPFFSGKSAMEIGGEWVPGEITAEVPHLRYGVAPVPVGAGYKPGSLTFVSPGNFYVLPRRISYPKASAELLIWLDQPYADNYLATKEGNLDPEIGASTPGSAFWTANPPLRPWLNELHNAGNHAPPVAITPVYSYWETIRPTYEQEILSGKISPAAGLAALQSKIAQYQREYTLTHPGW